MKKVVVILSADTDLTNFADDADYWIMQGVLSETAVDAFRREGSSITTFDAAEPATSDVPDILGMALLHNQDWRELTVIR